MNLLGSAVTAIKPRIDDTIIDRLNYYYSTVIIMVMSVTITAKQYVGSPIQCWVPAQFTKAWEQYAENYCFVYNTYWVAPNEDIPDEVQERIHRQLIYYQWVPFIMALEAGFFFLPSIFWGQTNAKSGLNITNMIKLAQTANTSEDAERDKAIVTICHQMEDSVRLRQVRLEGSSPLSQWFKFGLVTGSYVANVYTLTKVLYLVNVIGQFLMMNQFLGQNNHMWGAHILTDIIHGRDWELSGNFPRIAICDFQVRTLGNLHRYSIQCVLVLNMFNEKIFLFLYYWFVIVAILTFIDVIVWTLNTRITSRRVAYVARYVKASPDNDYLFRQFCTRSISSDSILLLRLISSHSNELVTSDILNFLWKTHASSKCSLNNVGLIANHFNRKDGADSRNSYDMDTPLVLVKHNV